MLKPLSETKKAVLEAIRMRLHENEALAYLAGVGHPMKRANFYKHKKDLESKKLERLHFIAKIGLQDQHLDRIDDVELAVKLMWQNYHLCKNPFQKALILEKIINVQPYISTYYDATKSVMEKSDNQSIKEDNSISQHSITTE